MKNRIEIDGVWYVREDNTIPKIDLQLTDFVGIVTENEKYCFEATRIYRDDGTLYGGVDIKFTDKRVKPWKEDHWDSEFWYKGIREGNPESLIFAKKVMDDDGIEYFQAFLEELAKRDWL